MTGSAAPAASTARSFAQNARGSWVFRLLAAAVVAELALAVTDLVLRGETFAPRVGAAVALSMALGTFGGLVTAPLAAVALWLDRRYGRARSRMARAAPILLPALVVSGVSLPTARWAFSGNRVSASWLAWAGPPMALMGVLAAAGVTAALTRAGLRAARADRSGLALAVAMLFAFGGAACVWVDCTLWVGLYLRLHSALEGCAILAWTCAGIIVLGVADPHRPGSRVAVMTFSVCSLLMAMAWIHGPTGLRAWVDGRIASTLRHPSYLARNLLRVRVAEAYWSSDGKTAGLVATGLASLEDHYDLGCPSRGVEWDAVASPNALEHPARTRGLNVLVFYTDTLRADVAADPSIMPNAVRFADSALNFRHAYAPGSDTRSTLPGLIGGSYDAARAEKHNLMLEAENADVQSFVAIPRSASEFLGKLYPTFAFAETAEVVDYAGSEVWGYGADRPTAETLVDRTLDFVKARGDERFFAWVFNFDLHSWRELDDDFVEAAAERLRIPQRESQAWRYQAIAATIDEQFGRLLAGIERLGRTEDTVVLFVSDHGEALGADGFWVHGIFLWENLIHVPLSLRVPGVGGHTVDQRVSLIDVAPTLARFINPEADLGGSHGEDLMDFVVAPRPRRLPILSIGMRKEDLVRVAVLDATSTLKLVLPLETGAPELYDTAAPDPDLSDLSSSRTADVKRLLSQLVRAPTFPRHVCGAEPHVQN